jgi:DNA-binding transcriptional MerR regulator
MERKASQTVDIPENTLVSIADVSAMVEVPVYVLRFWETEFSGLQPTWTDSGQRLYGRRDLELMFQIKHLLYDRKMSVEAAKQHLTAGLSSGAPSIDEIRRELQIIRDLLG